MGVHDGHRKRMRTRFLEHGADTMEDHALLELLLYYACPRVDTNPLAHRLLEHFGGIHQVLDAPVEELQKVTGIGESAAALLKLVPQIVRRAEIRRSGTEDILNTTEKAGQYLVPYFATEQDEVVYMLCLDAKCKAISCRLLFRGSVNSAVVNVRTAVEYALRCKATSVILAHNHTSGLAIPSREDESTTRRLCEALAAVDVRLVDHIIVAEGDYVSLADSGYFRNF